MKKTENTMSGKSNEFMAKKGTQTYSNFSKMGASRVKISK